VSPSTTKPQDAFKVPKVGTWTCFLCQPNVSDRGGHREFYAHYNREHLALESEATS
jgi:hypothetical protein